MCKYYIFFLNLYLNKVFLLYLQVEAKKPEDKEWEFIRICHLHVAEKQPVRMGVLACAPTDSGGSAVFSYLSCKPTEGHAHTN